MEERIFVGVGSNIEPERNIIRAGLLLRESVMLVAVSTFFRTQPLERPGQADFLNGVFEIRSDLEPSLLKFTVLRQVEAALGRSRSADSHAPREIDLDLLLYGSRQLAETTIKLPDPDIERRAFIAVPLCELAPDIVIPGGIRLKSMSILSNRSSLKPDYRYTEELKARLLQ